jgi:ABC-2 type transport system permease protein
MLIRILHHEWKNLLADRTLWVLTGLFAVVTFYGVYNGARWASFQRETIAQALQEESERLRGHREFVASGAEPPTPWRDPRSPYSVGGSMGRRYAYLPPSPLAPLAVGQSDLYPYYFQVSTGSKQSFLNNYELENPENLLAGRFDLAFAIVYLFPLLILALSYNVLSAEKEQGTLAMVLSQPVSLRTLAFGKIALRAVIVLALGLGLATAAYLASGSAVFASLGPLLLWTSVVAAYCLLWFSVAVAVNAFGRSSAANAMILAGIWLVLVVIVPASVNLFVTGAYPVPSRVELVQAIREATNDANARAAQVMSRYFLDHPEMVPQGEAPDPNDYQTRSYAIREDVERAMAPVLARYDEQLLAQQAQVDRLKYLSPSIVAQEALNDIAGTGLARYKHFLGLVDRFHQEWRDYFVPKVFARRSLTASDYEAFPAFQFGEESGAAVRGRVSAGLAGLVVPLILVFAAGMGGLRRYPVTG